MNRAGAPFESPGKLEISADHRPFKLRAETETLLRLNAAPPAVGRMHAFKRRNRKVELEMLSSEKSIRHTVAPR